MIDHLFISNHIAWVALFAFVSTCLSIYLLNPIAKKLGLVDRPGGRKHHEGKPALIGGIAMVIAFTLSSILFLSPFPEFNALYVGIWILVIVGVMDDFKDLSPKTRLFTQLIAVLLAIIGGNLMLTDLGTLIPPFSISLSLLALPFTIFAMLSLINAINMSDGLDGLAGTLCFICLGYLCLLAVNTGHDPELHIMLIAMSVIAGFLCFNLPIGGPARLFMGDAGSLFLGFLLAWFTVSLAQHPDGVTRPVVIIWMIALPLFDLLSVFLRRIKRGQSPFKPGRDHIHHQLLDCGFSGRQTLVIMAASAIILGAVGFAGHVYKIPDSVLFLCFLICFLGSIIGLKKLRTHTEK